MPRRLWRDGAIVADDWHVTSDGELSDDEALILTFAEWQAERER
jgi:uncharacterized protein (DUF934 family)